MREIVSSYRQSSKFIFLYVHLFVSGCVLIVYFGLNFIGIELAGQLDEGKGLAITVAGIKKLVISKQTCHYPLIISKQTCHNFCG